MIENTKWPSCERCIQDGCLEWEDGMPHEFRVHEDAIYYFDRHYGWEGETISFCPFCGRPLTDEAWTELKKRLEGHYATSDWISVKDRLPEESGDYLALQNSVNQYVLHFSSRHQAFNCYDFDEIAKYKSLISPIGWNFQNRRRSSLHEPLQLLPYAGQVRPQERSGRGQAGGVQLV